MRNIKILSRHKNSTGNTIFYTVEENNVVYKISKEDLLNLQIHVTNASVTTVGEFRAHNGSNIDTIRIPDMPGTGLMIATENRLINKVKNDISSMDYYGKESVNICRKIRKYAYSGNIAVQRTPHRANQGLNIYLINLIESCGISFEDFVIGYISVIQPYCLEKFSYSKEGAPKGQIWISDLGYNIALIIKIDKSNTNKPLVISFHESNRHNNFKTSRKNFSDKKCAVLIDDYMALQPDGYLVKYSVQRGFIRYNDIKSGTHLLNNDLALVDYKDIKAVFDTTLRNVFEALQSNYTDYASVPLEVSKIENEKLSFMSIGYLTINNLCMLIDLYSIYTDGKARAVLAEIANNVVEELTLTKRTEFKVALQSRFSGAYTNELLEIIKNNL